MKEESLLDLVKQENFEQKFVLESFREFDNPGWLVEIGFSTATDLNSFLNSAMFERLFENGYAEKYRIVRICDNQVIYSRESDCDCD